MIMMKRTVFYICISLLTAGIFYSCKDEIENTLEPKFTADNQVIVAGSKVIFSDESTGSPSTWKWTFEGGSPSTSNLTSPEVTYSIPGSYKVTLTIGRQGDTVSVSEEDFITVSYDDVAADFTSNVTTINQDNSVSFTDLSTGIPTAWSWKMYTAAGGDTIRSSEQNPTITFTSPGVYTVSLKVTNPISSDTEVKSDFLTVIDITSVEADFSSDFNSTYEGGAINFTDKSLGSATSWSWTFEGGSPSVSSDQNPVVTYSTAGRYTVKLVVANEFKSSEKEITKYVLVVPGSGIVAFYPFDGDSKDAGPNKVDPSNNGTGTIIYTEADRQSVNTCATFDGASVLVAPDNSAFNFGTNDFSISCWVRTTLTTKMMIWMESGGVIGTGDLQTWLRIGDNTTTRKVRFDCEDASGSNIVNVATGVSDGSWHHVVCIREGLTSSVYIDGVLALSQDATSIKEVSSSQPFKIGAQEATGGGTYSAFFTGSIDELILYNRPLTATEVSNLFGL